MKTFNININTQLKGIEITVKNGNRFINSILAGAYNVFDVKVNDTDLKRIKKYAIKNGNDNSSNYGKWYARCIDYSMGLYVDYLGNVSINTYSEYRMRVKNMH